MFLLQALECTRKKIPPAVLVMVTVFLVLNPPLFSAPQIPEPGGDYQVGTTVFQLTDESRDEINSDDPDDKRTIFIQAWYPADPAGDEPIAPYWSDPALISTYVAKFQNAYPVLLKEVSEMQTHSYQNAPVSSGQESFPVLLFSHGYGGLETQNTSLFQELASQGYIIFSIAHPYETAITIFTDKTYITYDDMSEELQKRHNSDNEKYSSENGGIQAKVAVLKTLETINASVLLWSGDITFLTDELEKFQSGEEPSLFTGKLDLTRIGAFGQSFGGCASVQFSVDDSRCQAAINFDGLQWGVLFGKEVTRPLMMFYSDMAKDITKGVHEMFYPNSNNKLYTLTIKGSFHNDYSDLTLLRNFKDLKLLGPIDGERMIHIVNRYVTAFFDRYLKGTCQPLLSGPSANFPEVLFEITQPAN